MQITHRRRETLMPHDFLHQSRIFRLCHSDGAERVPCAIQLQGIRNFELASHTSERVLPLSHLVRRYRRFTKDVGEAAGFKQAIAFAKWRVEHFAQTWLLEAARLLGAR